MEYSWYEKDEVNKMNDYGVIFVLIILLVNLHFIVL